MKNIRVAIIGLGSVGKNIAQLLNERCSYYSQSYGLNIKITGICKSNSGLINNEIGLDLNTILNFDNYTFGLTNTEFMEKIEADVIFEVGPSNYLTGGSSLKYISEALSRKIHVICISKGALVLELNKLLEMAHQNQVKLLYSGATAAALPTVDFINCNLTGCKILEIEGILTGTTNFILDEMMQKNLCFDESLGKARELGIAESDSSFDIEGWDTAAKIIIIAQTILRKKIEFNDVFRSGIENVTNIDIQSWRSQNLVPRLIGYYKKRNKSFEIGVKLKLFSNNHPFSLVLGKNKSIRILTEEMGEFYISGGASSPLATAAAALKDLENILRQNN